MKANELMIGDWVYRPDCYDQVKEIRQNGIIGLDSLRGLIGFSELEPIPLTPDILKKNGFEYFHKNYSSLSYDHPFKLKMTNWPDENGLGGLWTICDIVEIRFVHQLQHALRLCEIDKTIEL